MSCRDNGFMQHTQFQLPPLATPSPYICPYTSRPQVTETNSHLAHTWDLLFLDVGFFSAKIRKVQANQLVTLYYSPHFRARGEPVQKVTVLVFMLTSCILGFPSIFYGFRHILKQGQFLFYPVMLSIGRDTVFQATEVPSFFPLTSNIFICTQVKFEDNHHSRLLPTGTGLEWFPGFVIYSTNCPTAHPRSWVLFLRP